MTDFMLPAKSDEYSTEIAPQIQNIYSVTKIRGMSPRVIDIFIGAECKLLTFTETTSAVFHS